MIFKPKVNSAGNAAYAHKHPCNLTNQITPKDKFGLLFSNNKLAFLRTDIGLKGLIFSAISVRRFGFSQYQYPLSCARHNAFISTQDIRVG